MKDELSELWELVVAYVKQETLDPIKALGRYVALGLAGSCALILGIGIAVLGVLRLLQDETGTALTGHLSWIPYLACAVVAIAIAGACVVGILHAKPSRRGSGVVGTGAGAAVSREGARP